MSDIDYQAVRSMISMADVLKWIGFIPTTRGSPQLRGRCPLPHCPSRSDRTFSVHLEKGIYHCFGCRSHGNYLDLWAAIHHLSLYQAALDLCDRAHIPVVPLHDSSPATPPLINASKVSSRNQRTGTL